MSDCKDIAEIIADYRLHDRKNGLLKIEINRDHVERWIEQFPQNQDIILHKTKKLLSRYYFSEDNVYSFLELVAESEELWEDPEEAMGTAYFLDCQTEGKSQNHLLDMMEEVVLNTYDFDIKRTAVPIDGPATYIYLDDGLFSGRTLIRDMEALLPHIHSGSTVCAIFIIDYSFGDWWSHRRLNNTFQENRVSDIGAGCFGCQRQLPAGKRPARNSFIGQNSCARRYASAGRRRAGLYTLPQYHWTF